MGLKLKGNRKIRGIEWLLRKRIIRNDEGITQIFRRPIN